MQTCAKKDYPANLENKQMSNQKSPLLVLPNSDQAELIHLTPQQAGWDYLHVSVRRMHGGQAWEFDTAENELALVVLGGVCSVTSNRGNFPHIGRRPDVFSGMPYSLYLPRRTKFTIQATSQDLEIACAWCPTNQDHPPRLVTPPEVAVEIRGGENATRQINKMLPPGFDCQRLVAVEVYTPSGNWSSYPPHKHDVTRLDHDGAQLEADLEEIYFYKFDRPEGYAYQRVYSADGRLDELMLVHENQLVMVPEGYHPVVAAHGYNAYYLNFLAGEVASLTATDDPQYTWVKANWKDKDPRLPLVSMQMEK
jgi:5-deoxy-glucuronate isomerase